MKLHANVCSQWEWTKLRQISGIVAEKGRKCTEWLSIKAFMKPNSAKRKNEVTQRKAEY